MGGNGSASRNVSFGLDEEEKVTVIEGVKLSDEVLRRMREAKASQGKGSPPHADHQKPAPSPSVAEIQEEMLKKFEQEQALVQEQLARLAQREKERDSPTALAAVGGNNVTSAMIMEQGRTHEELEKAKILPAELDAWAKQLERKERELATISAFYKEQLETLEKKNLDNYKQTTEQYAQAQTKAESHIRPRHTTAICTELQGQVFKCYRDNPQQTLACSSLARQYMNCIQQAKQVGAVCG
uniref:Coiled-coil-helix-coiled-coil-helix domain containing 6b n=1 Tax=Gadus morhua TaxID=8049 RepID=A0A8C5BM98_GADMO